MPKYNINENIDLFKEVVKESTTFVEIRRKMGYEDSGGWYRFVKRKCKELGIDYSHVGKPASDFEVSIEEVRSKAQESSSVRELAIRLKVVV
jgi:hypothetical protein